MKVSLLFGLVFGCAFGFATQAAGTTQLPVSDAVKQKGTDLEVSLVAMKRTYKPKDRIKLEVTLTNNNAVKELFVYGTLEFGYRGSFMLHRRDAKGKEVPTRMIDEALEMRPKSDDISAFVKLLPFHFLGTTYRSSIYFLNMEKPGRYSIWVEYHCPISIADVRVSPFWGSESGTIKSNIVRIEVVR